MVVKKSLFKGKLLYWFILVICLSLFLIPKYYMMTEPENFVYDEYSEYEGKPILDCNVKIDEYSVSPFKDEISGIYVKKNGTKCLITKIPRVSYFSVKRPLLYTVIFKWGNVIGILAIIICLIPWRKKDEHKKKEGKIESEDRKDKK